MENIEAWIEKEHDRALGSEEDLAMYQQKMKEILGYLKSFEILEDRKNNSEYLSNKSNILRVEIENLLKTEMVICLLHRVPTKEENCSSYRTGF